MQSNPQTMTPVTILTGYLGAGKTTLVNRILHGDHGVRVAVLVDDFGAVNIESRLIVGVEGEMVTLANGCICGPIRGDLVEVVYGLLQIDKPPQNIIIETSGVADPVHVVLTFNRSVLRSKAQIDSIMAVVDAEHITEVQGKPENLLRDQIRVADFVIINKIDLISEGNLKRVRNWVNAVVPTARILEAEYADVPIDLILGIGTYNPQRAFDKSGHGVHVHTLEEMGDYEHHDHSLVYGTWTWRCDEPLAFTKVRQVLDELPATVFRAKGFLYLQEFPDRQVILQIVGRRASLTLGDTWAETAPGTELVLIGESITMDGNLLSQQFESIRGSEPSDSAVLDFVDSVWTWIRFSSLENE